MYHKPQHVMETKLTKGLIRKIAEKNAIAKQITLLLLADKEKFHGAIPMLIDMNICGERLVDAYNICGANVEFLYKYASQEDDALIRAINIATAKKGGTQKVVAGGAFDTKLGRYVPQSTRNALPEDFLEFTQHEISTLQNAKSVDMLENLIYPHAESEKYTERIHYPENLVKQNPKKCEEKFVCVPSMTVTEKDCVGKENCKSEFACSEKAPEMQ